MVAARPATLAAARTMDMLIVSFPSSPVLLGSPVFLVGGIIRRRAHSNSSESDCCAAVVPCVLSLVLLLVPDCCCCSESDVPVVLSCTAAAAAAASVFLYECPMLLCRGCDTTAVCLMDTWSILLSVVVMSGGYGPANDQEPRTNSGTRRRQKTARKRRKSGGKVTVGRQKQQKKPVRNVNFC